MEFKETYLPGVFIVEATAKHDERGFFARIFCEDEFSAAGINFKIKQINNSLSKKAGTLRGLHYQAAPYGEDKFLRCVFGSVADIVVDLRPGSPKFKEAIVEVLSATNRRAIFIPKGCAHGFMTLEENSEVIYASSSAYSKGSERILRWNDPVLNLPLPMSPQILSEKDQTAPDFQEDTHGSGYQFIRNQK